MTAAHFGRVTRVTVADRSKAGLFVAVCDDCPWTGSPQPVENTARLEWYRHHEATIPHPMMPTPISPTEPAIQPALF